jgi:phage/plasmid-associated DNA primase
MDYQILVEAPPVKVDFDAIRWPANLVLPWRSDRLARQYGAPFVFSKGKPTGLNERFWAGLFLAENRLLHEPDERAFYLYESDNGLWRPITAEALAERVAERIFRYRLEANEPGVESLIKQSRVKAIIDTLRGMGEQRDAFTRKGHFIHVGNGVVRFEPDGDIRLTGYRPDDRSRNQSPINFEATAQCPRFFRELILSAVEVEDAALIQQWFGVALFGVNLPQRILLLTGTPAGGKSTLASIVASVVGRENVYQLRTQALLERFETFRYRGKTLLIGADVPGDFLMHRGAAVLKALVGGDLLSAEGKGLNGDFQMRGTFNVLITCNSRLTVRLEGDTAAWRRRLLPVPYQKPPPEHRIQNFDQLLLDREGPGILRWGLAGFVKAMLSFDRCGDFDLTETQRVRIDSLLAESDSGAQFLDAGLTRADEVDVSVQEAVESYSTFCADRGWCALPITELYRALDDLMLRRFQVTKRHDIERGGKRVRGWKGVRLV